jgi:hypothetical protein
MLQCEDQSAWTESVTRHLLTAGLFQVKNTAALAHALAITKGARLSYARVSQALTVTHRLTIACMKTNYTLRSGSAVLCQIMLGLSGGREEMGAGVIDDHLFS